MVRILGLGSYVDFPTTLNAVVSGNILVDQEAGKVLSARLVGGSAVVGKVLSQPSPPTTNYVAVSVTIPSGTAANTWVNLSALADVSAYKTVNICPVVSTANGTAGTFAQLQLTFSDGTANETKYVCEEVKGSLVTEVDGSSNIINQFIPVEVYPKTWKINGIDSTGAKSLNTIKVERDGFYLRGRARLNNAATANVKIDFYFENSY